ncbi:ABC transporter permease [Peribacillus saganii]|uniref:ABC transporter permease n=1 Tax=Peribacillus saganii TaxID=2303992 RepID=A0A372LFS1_9BACI|nr:ABC transporter permease [Peribacillus saganii]RFU64395.1 ABC transporter permease [Peribacillus saganii]
MNSVNFWKERFQTFSKELQKYLRYIFNGHLLFVLIFAVGGLAYYYSEWIKTLDSGFPSAIILAVLLGLMITSSPIYTFLREADMIFLLPLEKRLDDYFKRSIILSLVIQGYLLLMVLAAGFPMHSKVTGASFQDFVLIFMLMLVIKYMNLVIRWHVLKFQETSTLWLDNGVRLAINIVLLYFLLSRANLFLTIITLALLIGLMLYYRQAGKEKGLKWERLIDLEGKRLMSFYRLANMFTDVPKLKEKVSRRKWLDWLLSFIPYRQTSSYTYLYARSLLRTDDYFGLFLRLTVIGSFVILAFTSMLPVLFTAVLFLYMTGLQLMAVGRNHEMKIWINLYPLPQEKRLQSIINLLQLMLLVETVIFAVVVLFTGEWITAFATLAAGLAFILFFRSYAAKKISAL